MKKRFKLCGIKCAMCFAVWMLPLTSMAEEITNIQTDESKYNALAFGDKGDHVTEVQIRLKELGYYNKLLDGDYGNGMKTAVASFQARNGLPANGVADEITIEMIFSDNAIHAPELPNLSISNVRFDSSTAYMDIVNNTDETVDTIKMKVLTYDVGGKIYGTTKNLSNTELGLTGSYTIGNLAFKPGQSGETLLNIYDLLDYNTKYIGVYIDEYHTTSGNYYAYSPDQVYVYKSDSSIEFPTDESKPAVMNEEKYLYANTVKFGCTTGKITDWLSPFYLYHSGAWISDIREGSTFDLAGFKVDDVIIAFDDVDVLSGFSWEYVKLKMLEGKSVSVHYWRNNKECTTEIALDMNLPLEKETESYNSLADELERIISLYEKGALTDEEYAIAKEKILSL